MNQPELTQSPDFADEFGLKPGSHLVSPRLAWIHHGLYLGQGRVIHYRGLSRGLCAGPVEEVSLQAFADGNAIGVLAEPLNRQVARQTVANARMRLGENAYAVFDNNCEHFCNTCAWGLTYSLQIERFRLHGTPRRAAGRLVRLLGRTLNRWIGASRAAPQFG